MNEQIRLMKGDCLKLMGALENGSIDMILADLPYGTTSCAWDEILPFDQLWENYGRVIKPNGVICLFGSQPFSSKLIMSKPEWFRYELIWNKNKCGSPGLAKKRPMKVHENILIFYKVSKGSTYNPIMEKGEPYHRKSKNKEGYVSKRNTHSYGLKPMKELNNTGTRYPKSILNKSRNFSAQQQIHPTQKPTTVLDWLVETYSNEGETILDNVMGSGSTALSCLNLNRNFIGMEFDEDYFAISKARIEEYRKKLLDKLE